MNVRTVVGSLMVVGAVLAGGRVAPGAAFSFTKIADESTSIPDGSGTFTGFDPPSVSGGKVAFMGNGASSQKGVYTNVPGSLTKVVDRNDTVPGEVFNYGNFNSFSFDGTNVAYTYTGGGIYTNVGGTFNIVAAPSTASFPTAIPGGSGDFTSLATPSIHGGKVAFEGSGASSQNGIYSNSSGTLGAVADTGTPIPPALADNFTSFNGPAIHSGNVAFRGASSFPASNGIYTSIGGSTSAVADLTTSIPSGSGSFTGFNDPSFDGTNVVFPGTGASQSGIYTDLGGSLVAVADETTLIPDGSGTFTSFSSPTLDGGVIAFVGGGSASQLGIYSTHGGSLMKVIDNGDLLDGKVIASSSLALRLATDEGLDGDSIAFEVRFDDGTEGIYLATLVPEPSSFFLAGVAVSALGWCGWRRRRRR